MKSTQKSEISYQSQSGFKPRLTLDQQLEILNKHPFFTGVCPQCGYQFGQNNDRDNWDCPECDWKTDILYSK
jgi:rubrerythrin